MTMARASQPSGRVSQTDPVASSMTTEVARVWLAQPAAAAHFDPAQQTAADAPRWSQLGAPARRVEWAVSRALLAHLAKQRLTHSSLSHSRSWCAALTAPANSCAGVDLEWARPRDVLALARVAFASSEYVALEGLPERQCQQHFYVMWTLKEAFAKALGLGLLAALRECVFEPRAGGWCGRLPADGPWQAFVYAPRPGLVLAVAGIGDVWVATEEPATAEWPERQVGDWELLARVRPGPPTAVRARDLGQTGQFAGSTAGTL